MYMYAQEWENCARICWGYASCKDRIMSAEDKERKRKPNDPVFYHCKFTFEKVEDRKSFLNDLEAQGVTVKK